MSCASLSSIKKKKKFKNKRNIKSRKIDKRKRKMLVFKAFYNSNMIGSRSILPIRTVVCRNNTWARNG